MSSAETTEYNDVAIATAARLHDLRSADAAAKDDAEKRTLTLEELVPPFNTTAVGVAREWERMGGQHASPELQDQAAGLGARFEHLSQTIGTVIHDVDLRNRTEELIAFVRAALLERKVIFFRDQNLSEDDQVAFGRCFGGLDAFPFGKPGENPYILEIRHGAKNPGRENAWHTDVTWMERPSLGSIAQLIEKPDFGGDTLFADSHAAYFGLPSAFRDRVDHLDGVNDYRIFLAGRGTSAVPDDVADEIKAMIPFGVTHPMIRTHPETGKQAIFLNAGFLRHDALVDRRTGEQLDPQESRSIVKRLLEQHARPEYTCRFEWQVGSIAFWDNRAVQHYAASDYYPNRRVLRRVTVHA